MSKRAAEHGFTITELIISITVAGFLAAVLFIATFFYYANIIQAQTTTDLALESQVILSQLTDDIRLSDAIVSTNSITDPHAPTGGWHTSDPSNIMIVQNPAVTSGRDIIYDSNTGFPYKNEYIYFANTGGMYKRILANTAAVGNTAVTTCPAAQASSSCPPDRLFSANVSNLSFTFYDASNATTSDPTAARSVALEVDMAKKVFGKNITLQNSTRVTLRNL
jgi:prepilin-type N-terminal cleavage/methylation domain-containing protein